MCRVCTVSRCSLISYLADIITDNRTNNIFNTDALNVNKKPATTGSYLSDDLLDSDNTYTTQVYEYTGERKLAISDIKAALFRVSMYNSSKKWFAAGDAGFAYDEGKGCYTFTVSNSSCKYYRIWWMSNKTDYSDVAITDYDEWTSNIQPYTNNSIVIENLELTDSTLAQIEQELNYGDSGNIVCLGDSIARGDGNSYVSYADMIADEIGYTITKYAVGGATLCPELNTDNNIVAQLDNIIDETADIILLDGGINDIGADEYSSDILGTPSSLSTTMWTTDISTDKTSTVCGSLEYVLATLQSKFPNAQIIFIFVHKIKLSDVQLQYNMRDYFKEICLNWGVKFVDIFGETPLNTYIDIYNSTYIYNSDYYHPNEKGYELFYVPMIKDAIQKSVD